MTPKNLEDSASVAAANGWKFNGDEWQRISTNHDSDGSFTRVEMGYVFADTSYAACEYDGLPFDNSESFTL